MSSTPAQAVTLEAIRGKHSTKDLPREYLLALWRALPEFDKSERTQEEQHKYEKDLYKIFMAFVKSCDDPSVVWILEQHRDSEWPRLYPWKVPEEDKSREQIHGEPSSVEGEPQHDWKVTLARAALELPYFLPETSGTPNERLVAAKTQFKESAGGQDNMNKLIDETFNKARGLALKKKNV